MMPTRESTPQGRSVRNIVDAVGYLSPTLQVAPPTRRAIVANNKHIPAMMVPTRMFTPVDPNDNAWRSMSTSKQDMLRTPSPFADPTRKAAPSPALTAATEAMSDCSFTTRDSPANFSSSSGYISPIMPKNLEEHINRVVPVAMKPPKVVQTSAMTRDRDDEVRKTRIKTELCMHVGKGTVCPFGEQCTFAHSEEELKMTKLIDLERAGLIDNASHYRSKPCFNYLSTGSCPFGRRCNGLHDPRTAGQAASWLPVTETQGNSIASDLNVESLHQKRAFTVQNDNPFGCSFSLDDKPNRLYERVCNMNREEGLKRQSMMLSEMHKVSIALQMQGSPDFSYKFRPQSIIGGELCMELTPKRSFRLTATGAVELELQSYDRKNPSHVLCREIAFGPDSDPSVRGVSIWFNIGDEDVKMCTPQQAKRFRWKRGLHNKNKNDKAEEEKAPSIFEHLECFEMIRPMDPDAFRLCSIILEHRLAFLQAQHVSDTSLMLNEGTVKVLFEGILHEIECHLQHWKQWSWPKNEGRNHIDENTCVPAVDGHFYKDTANMSPQNPATKKIWESFVTREAGAWKKLAKKRLPIFVKLSRGQAVSQDRNLPHIRNKAYDSSSHEMNETSEKCWQSLLLQGSADEVNEWEIVREHFLKSRSKKVLSILQQ